MAGFNAILMGSQVLFSLLVKKTTPEFQNGSVHPVVHNLGERKLVKTRQQEVACRVRSYYRITAARRKRFKELGSSFEKTAGSCPALRRCRVKNATLVGHSTGGGEVAR